MKTIFTYITVFLGLATSLSSQIDQISVGAGYSQQAYYSLSTGEVETVDNEAWDISFSAIGQQDAGVFINESVSAMSTAMQLFVTDVNDWSENITNTDQFDESVTLQNPDLNWTEGAFNTVKDPTSPFDFGWGAYNPQTNIVEGTKVFVIKKRDGSFIKLRILSLEGGIYTFKYANLDGSNEKTYQVVKADETNGFIHFSFDTDDIVDMPSEYDLIFQRYTTPLDAGDGSFIEYTVTGVLLANGVEAVVADGVDPTSVIEADYADQYSSLLTTIGHSWKSFDFEAGWVIDEDRTHFVKTTTDDIYQLTFFDFEGSSTGTTTLERSFITSVSTKDEVEPLLSLSIYPNPTTNYFTIQTEKNKPLNVSITNVSGQLVSNESILTNEEINVANLPIGIYNVTIQSTGSAVTQRLVVSR